MRIPLCSPRKTSLHIHVSLGLTAKDTAGRLVKKKRATILELLERIGVRTHTLRHADKSVLRRLVQLGVSALEDDGDGFSPLIRG